MDEHLNQVDDICGICSDHIRTTHMPAEMGANYCRHYTTFHPECINAWHATQRALNVIPSCPICRAEWGGAEDTHMPEIGGRHEPPRGDLGGMPIPIDDLDDLPGGSCNCVESIFIFSVMVAIVDIGILPVSLLASGYVYLAASIQGLIAAKYFQTRYQWCVNLIYFGVSLVNISSSAFLFDSVWSEDELFLCHIMALLKIVLLSVFIIVLFQPGR